MVAIYTFHDLINYYDKISNAFNEAADSVFVRFNDTETIRVASPFHLEEVYKTAVLLNELEKGLSDIESESLIDLEEAKKRLI